MTTARRSPLSRGRVTAQTLSPSEGAAGGLTVGGAVGRWTLAATVLGSGMAFLDGTVVNVALPAITRDLDATVAGAQWTITGYALTLASLILLGGSLGDRYGRRRLYVVGVTWFVLASIACAAAPTIWVLVAARILQGVGGALLTPGSLAIIAATFAAGDRSRAIGIWSGLSGVTTLLGPFVGGWLVDAASWRWVFVINVPIGLAVVAITARHVPESRDASATGGPDLTGAALATAGLAGITYGLIGLGGGVTRLTVGALVAGAAALAAFVVVEQRRRRPLVPLGMFAERQFTAANLVTFFVYAALSGVSLFVTVQLQVGAGYSALAAGAAMAPVTVLLLLLSPRAGALCARIGPRLPMSAGPLLSGVGAAMLALAVGMDAPYLTHVLPGVVVFGLGLALTVAPLTATVLGAAEQRHAGIASGVNNAVARTAGLLAIAVLPPLAGIAGDDFTNAVAFTSGYRTAMLFCAGALALGGLLAAVTIRNTARLGSLA